MPQFKSFPIKFVLISISAFIAALGTVPYGLHFANPIQKYSHFFYLLCGAMFAITALFANAALGTYSLLNAKLEQDLINPYFLAVGSVISAIPNGFICYFGYKESLPFLIDLMISITVVLVNAGIAYTAIYHFLADTLHPPDAPSTSFLFRFASKTGFILGLLVSSTFYVVTVYGLTQLFSMVIENSESAFNMACVFGLAPWIPGAALYSNSSRITSEKIALFIEQTPQKTTNIHPVDIIIFLIALGSGASFCQIAINFFDPSKDIPAFIKYDVVQQLVYQFIVPCAFIFSAAVNYLALKRLQLSLASI